MTSRRCCLFLLLTCLLGIGPLSASAGPRKVVTSSRELGRRALTYRAAGTDAQIRPGLLARWTGGALGRLRVTRRVDTGIGSATRLEHSTSIRARHRVGGRRVADLLVQHHLDTATGHDGTFESLTPAEREGVREAIDGHGDAKTIGGFLLTVTAVLGADMAVFGLAQEHLAAGAVRDVVAVVAMTAIAAPLAWFGFKAAERAGDDAQGNSRQALRDGTSLTNRAW